MSNPINCPACGARMTLCRWPHHAKAWYECACGLRGPYGCSASDRGAAIKAGRAMRRIVEMIEARGVDSIKIQKQYTDNAVREVMRLRKIVSQCGMCRAEANKGTSTNV